MIFSEMRHGRLRIMFEAWNNRFPISIPSRSAARKKSPASGEAGLAVYD
jgi:hypothetical protein